MEKYTVAQLKADVEKEARALRKHALPQEKENLRFGAFCSDGAMSCIYGLLTGDCRSERAAELIYTCCPRYFVNQRTGLLSKVGHREAVKVVNGTKIEGVSTASGLRSHRAKEIRHFSAIEAYILAPNARNANLIAFIKGETNTLKL